MISICVPSRKRQQKIRNLLKSIRETVSDKTSVEVLFFLDEDDLDTIELTLFEEFPDLMLKFFRCKFTIISGERYNFLYFKSSGDVLMYGSDDMVFTKKDWNVEVQEIFSIIPDKIALVFSPDIIHGDAIPTHGFVSRISVNILGYLFYPRFRSWYNDSWLSGLYKPIGRYMPIDLGIIHQHYSQGYGTVDETYLKQEIVDDEGLTPVDHDHITWATHQEQLSVDIGKLKEYIDAKRNRR